MNNIYCMLILALFVIGCNRSNNKEDDKIINQDTFDIVKIDSNSNTVIENNISPYKQVDSLQQLLKKEYNESVVLKLDSICNKSDGDLNENFYEITSELWNYHLKDFTEFLTRNGSTCLEKQLVLGIGADLSVYEKEQREIKFWNNEINI